MIAGRLRRDFPGWWMAFLVVLASVGTFWAVLRENRRIHNDERIERLLAEARVVAWALEVPRASREGPATAPSPVQELVEFLRGEGMAAIIIDDLGQVVLNTTEQPVPPTLAVAPEVRQALATPAGLGTDLRIWGTAQRPHLMAAARTPPNDPDGRGYVWLTCPQWSITANPGAALRVLAHWALAVLILTALLILFYVRLRRRTLRRAVRAVRAMSAGELDLSLELRGSREFEALAHALQGLRRRLVAHAETLEGHRRMLRWLVDELQEGVLVIDGDGRIRLINPVAVRLLGLPPNANREGGLVGQPAESCIIHHQLQRLLCAAPAEARAEASDRAVTEPQPNRSDLVEARAASTGETLDAAGVPFRAPQGTTRVEIESDLGTRHLVARVAEIELAEPGSKRTRSPWGRLVTLTDVTDLQRSIQVRADFVANASHELRTPLTTIRAAVEALLGMDLTVEAPAARTFLEKIDRHSLRLQMMVADLLELSRLETPSKHFAPEVIDCRRLFHDLQMRFCEQLERKRLAWEERRHPPELHTIEANPYLLRLALDNLVDNAIKFTDPGGRIAVELWGHREEIRIVVRDTGCGIPEEEQQRVFERFYQVQRSRSGPDRGTGLGLSIVRHAVAVLRGTVHLRSEVGRGTEITIALPVPGSRGAALNQATTQTTHNTNASSLGEVQNFSAGTVRAHKDGDLE